MNKPNKTELEYFIRYSLDSDKYKRYMELYDEIERLNNIINDFEKYLEETKSVYEEYTCAIKKLKELKGVDKE